jgi:dTDP-4-dehydrorhamnose reductase
VGRPARQAPLEYLIADPVGSRRVLITGAGGQLGRALTEVWGEPVEAEPELVLHTSAYTDVDGAEADEEGARRVNVERTRQVVALGAPVVYFSTDYVFDGEKREPYVESDLPNPQSVYGRTKLEGEREIRDGWIVRSSWLFAPWGKNFVLTMLALGRERDEVSVVDDQRGCPTYVGHLAEATKPIVELPYGTYHVAADGDCTWAEFAEAIFDDAEIDCRVRRISSADLSRPAPRPAYSVLRSEHAERPRLPHWREGLRECLARVG